MCRYTPYDVFTVLNQYPDLLQTLYPVCDSVNTLEISEKLCKMGIRDNESIHTAVERFVSTESSSLLTPLSPFDVFLVLNDNADLIAKLQMVFDITDVFELAHKIYVPTLYCDRAVHNRVNAILAERSA